MPNGHITPTELNHEILLAVQERLRQAAEAFKRADEAVRDRGRGGITDKLQARNKAARRVALAEAALDRAKRLVGVGDHQGRAGPHNIGGGSL